MDSRQRRWITAMTLVLLMASVIGLQAWREQSATLDAVGNPDVLYVRSGEAMTRMALSYRSLAADVYWIRAVQHYGRTKLSDDPNKQYNLLYPLIDLTTTLDPRFNIAYHFGAVFLSEPFPGGPGRPDQAIAILNKGLAAQPEKWEFAQAIGFVYYWWLHDYREAAAWFQRAATLPDAPTWMEPLAAATLAEGGSRESSRRLWQQIGAASTSLWMQNEAGRRLAQLDAMDQLDQLQAVVARHAERTGQVPGQWGDLVRAGDLPGVPLDPAGTPYQLVDGSVTLGPDSELNPLPNIPARRP